MAKRKGSGGARFLTVGFTQKERDKFESHRKEIYPSEKEREYFEAQLARMRKGRERKYIQAKQKYGTSYSDRAGRAIGTVQRYRNVAQRQSSGFLSALGMGTAGGGYTYSNVKAPGQKLGRGRPQGPSGRYVIPGIGPVGVYEFRRYLRNKLRIEQLQARQQAIQNMSQYREYNQRQMAMQTPMEQRTIPNTTGFTPMGSIHAEIDSAASEVP